MQKDQAAADGDDVFLTEPTWEATFGRRLREERHHQGLTQDQLAKRLRTWFELKLDPTAIARIEKAERGLRLNEAMAICYALDVPLDHLLAWSVSSERELAEVEKRIVEEHQSLGVLMASTQHANERLRMLTQRRDELRHDLAETGGAHDE